MLQNYHLRLLPFHFDADPDRAFHFDADPDPASQNDRNTACKTEKNILERNRERCMCQSETDLFKNN